MGLGAGGRGQFLFERNPSDMTSATNVPLMKKRSDFGDMTMDFKVLFRIKKLVNDYIRGSYFLYLYLFYFFLIAFFPDALIFGFTIAFNSI